MSLVAPLWVYTGSNCPSKLLGFAPLPELEFDLFLLSIDGAHSKYLGQYSLRYVYRFLGLAITASL